MKNVSVIFPAARGQERTQEIINQLHDMNPGVFVEVIVSSPGMKFDRAVNTFDDMIGNAKAMALSYALASGDYIVWWSDRATPTPGCFERMIKFLDSKLEPFIGEFQLCDEQNYGKNETSPTFEVVGRQYGRWGMASRRTLNRIGGFFDPTFISFWVDVDMSLRCWNTGGLVQTCPDAWVKLSLGEKDKLHIDNETKAFNHDHAYFVRKWESRFPVMTEKPWREWNKERAA